MRRKSCNCVDITILWCWLILESGESKITGRISLILSPVAEKKAASILVSLLAKIKNFLFISCVQVYLYVRVHMEVREQLGRKSSPSTMVGGGCPGAQTQVIRLGSRCFYSVSHLSASPFYLFIRTLSHHGFYPFEGHTHKYIAMQLGFSI